MIKIIYVTSSFLHKNGGQVGKLVGPFSFASMELAKNAPLPSGCEFAFLSSKGEDHLFTQRFGWEPVAGLR